MSNRNLMPLIFLSFVGLVCQLGNTQPAMAKQQTVIKELKEAAESVETTEAPAASATIQIAAQESTDQPATEGAIRGVVTLDGQPVKGAKVEFAPVDGSGANSHAYTDEAGKFEISPEDQQSTESEYERALKKLAEPTIEIGENWTQLSKDFEVWVDKKAKLVMFAGHVCLTDGQLEMFICPRGTKEHESVIASSVLSSHVHAALLLIGCNPGKASAWDPVYRPVSGPTIDATLKWRDEKSGKTSSLDAKQWIRDSQTGKAMTQRWVFGGSGFWKDPDTGQEVYFGDSGELICLSNFSTATIDVDVKSSQANDGLMFEAFTENIPPVGTKVYTILKPGEIIKPEVKKEDEEQDSDKADSTAEQETEPEVVDQ